MVNRLIGMSPEAIAASPILRQFRCITSGPDEFGQRAHAIEHATMKHMLFYGPLDSQQEEYFLAAYRQCSYENYLRLLGRKGTDIKDADALQQVRDEIRT